MKKHVDDLNTFITNRGYHYNEETSRNWFAPKVAIKSGRRWRNNIVGSRPFHLRHTTTIGGASTVKDCLPPYLAPSEFSTAVCIAFWASVTSNRNWAVRLMREREREQRGGREEGSCMKWWGGLPVLMVGWWWTGKWGRMGREGGVGLFLFL